MNYSPATLAGLARRLYAEGATATALVQRLRPSICPFDQLLPLVPQGARVLDVGCGAGLFLNLLAATGITRQGCGFDTNRQAIVAARHAVSRQEGPHSIEFRQLDVADAWPAGDWDLVSMIDLMHHLPRQMQREGIHRVYQAMAPGSLFLYKDMVERPVWLAMANHAHDLLLAQQWIHCVPIDTVRDWCQAAGLSLVSQGTCRRLWYGHEWLLMRKPGPPSTTVCLGMARPGP